MFYIGNQAEGGCGIYLDVHNMERNRRGTNLVGIIGDGHYEGEVIIEVVERPEITFVDELWGDRSALRAFLDRHGEEKIRADLQQAVSVSSPRLREGRAVQPHVYMPLFDMHGAVNEDQSI